MSSFNNYNDSNFKPSTHISNLTKNLQQQTDNNTFIPNSLTNNHQFIDTNNFNNNTFHNSYNEQLNFIPSGRNTPSHIGSSYLSSFHNSFQSNSFKPPSIPTAMPTTSMETHDTLNAKRFEDIEKRFETGSLNKRFEGDALNKNQRFSIPNNLSFQEFGSSDPNTSQSTIQDFPILPIPDHYNKTSQSLFNESSFASQPPAHFTGNSFSQPDHYMSYKEFLTNLTLKDEHDGVEDNEHLNIVDYPVQDLIVMLSCLLTKIIEANDKLHPNHFDNTIAIRQKLKQERKEKRKSVVSTDVNTEQLRDIDIECVEVEEEDEDEDDEMKNKYLANVLAFHGTNVPGISLHAYLARVLKYCPVTNEVFLSLLVYFDRIAKKANNFKSKKKDDDSSDQPEQLFVMDLYNIHRLIISGITVSSKFFSDIFYKNLRYAKVGGLPLEELNYLELQFLLLLDFKLMISVEDLQNYADLLLRFWKREQLTEIINEK